MQSFNNQFSIDCNVHIQVVSKEGVVKSDQHFKNTATKHMTDGIALFLAGDGSVEHRGAWRPNFISFGTTGILKQPTSDNELAVVEESFEDKNPPEGERTRPWFFSTWLGERCPPYQHWKNHETQIPERDGTWSAEYGWSVGHLLPEDHTFQGELVSWFADDDVPEDVELIRRHPILRSEVTLDFPAARDTSIEGYATDCIFYGYSSVRWCNQFFKPAVGPEVPRLAISEVGLFERDSFPSAGLKTMMAGFRVPSADDIIYVSPDEVMLVEWRVTIRAVMPYEGVAFVDGVAPLGVNLTATVDESSRNAIKLLADVIPVAQVEQTVSWNLSGNDPAYPGTRLIITSDNTATLEIQEGDPTSVLYVDATARQYPNIHSRIAVVTSTVTDTVTAIAISLANSSESTGDYTFNATVLGKGTYNQTVSWTLTGNDSSDTTINVDPSDSKICMLHIDDNETSRQMVLSAKSVVDESIQSVAVVLHIDKTSGSYVISDFSILTE